MFPGLIHLMSEVILGDIIIEFPDWASTTLRMDIQVKHALLHSGMLSKYMDTLPGRVIRAQVTFQIMDSTIQVSYCH
jgi:hypothetical protein